MSDRNLRQDAHGYDADELLGANLRSGPESVTRHEPIQSVGHALERFAYVGEGDLVADLKAANPATAILKRTVFEVMHRFSTEEIAVGDGEMKRIKIASAWFANPGRMSLHGIGYNPLAGPVFIDDHRQWFNSFWMPSYKGKSIFAPDVSKFLAHMDLLVPTPAEREIVLDWFAHLLQYPGERNRFALMMVSRLQGTGRGWVVELMKAVLGFLNVKPFSMKEFESDFDDAFVDCLLNVVEEVREATEGKFTLGEKLKDRVTAQSTVANLKYGAKRLKRLHSSLLLQSNHPDALVLRDEDRRVLVIRTEAQPREDSYYVALYELLKEPRFVESIGALLAGRDLTAFRQITRAPMTAAKATMIVASTSELDDAIDDCIEAMPAPYFLSRHVHRYLEQQGQFGQLASDVPSIERVSKIVQERAMRVEGLPDNAIKIAGKKERPWAKSGVANKAELKAVRDAVVENGDWVVGRKSGVFGSAQAKADAVMAESHFKARKF